MNQPCPARLPALAFLGLSLASFALLGGCSGDENPGSGTVAVQLTDAAFEDLTSLTLTITRVDLVSDGGTLVRVFPDPSGDADPFTVDLVGLGNGRRLIGLAEAPGGGYTGARIAFRDAEGDAGGTAQTVEPDSGTIQVEFAETVVVGDEDVTGILLDFDGQASVESGGATEVELTPAVFHVQEDGRGEVLDLDGVVTDVDDGRFTFSADDADRGAGEDASPLGLLDAEVRSDTTFLLDGSVLGGTQGLSLLREDDVVQVSGRLVPGGVRADLVRVDRPGGESPVRVRGLITATDPSFTLRLTRIMSDPEDDLAGAAIGDLLTFTTGGGTSFLRTAGSGAFDAGDLFVGQAVEVAGSLSAPSTVEAASVELRETTLAGTLISLDLPGDGDVESDGDGVEDEDENTAVLEITEVDGVDVAAFPSIGDADGRTLVDLAAVSFFQDGQVPLTVDHFEADQAVEARGFFTAAGDGAAETSEFSGTSLSLEESEAFSGTVVAGSGDPGTGTFLTVIDGSNVRILLSSSSRLGVRDASRPGLIATRTRGDFVRGIDDAEGPVEVRGRQDGSEIRATSVVMETE